jgi:hypothetical protein
VTNRQSDGRFVSEGKSEKELQASSQEHDEARQRAEIQLLDGAADMKEYQLRRRAQSGLIVEPQRRQDEMSMADYAKSRQGRDFVYRGAMSYQDFCEWREAQKNNGGR